MDGGGLNTGSCPHIVDLVEEDSIQQAIDLHMDDNDLPWRLAKVSYFLVREPVLHMERICQEIL